MAEFFSSSRVLIVAGKGGVGKTTLGATIGVSASNAGLDTLLIELDGHSSLGRPFGFDQLPYEGCELRPDTARVAGTTKRRGRLRARRITPDDALIEYLGAHRLDRVGSRLIRTGAVDVVSTAAPGIRDLLALGKIRQLEEAGEADLIVVDAPAAGHAITFLRAAAGLADSSTSGPVREQADAVLAMLGDGRRCRVMLVTLPEETPVNELIETAFHLEDEVGVKLAPVVVNAIWPEIPGLEDESKGQGRVRSAVARARRDAAQYRLGRIETQREEYGRLASSLPLPQLHLPFLFRPSLDLPAIEHLGRALDAELARAGS